MAKVIDWVHRTFGEGVHLGYLNALECVSAAPDVTVDTGAAVVWGFPYDNSASVSVTPPIPVGDTRIDRIVLRADWATQEVRITRIAGTEGLGAPAITQTYGTTWDLMLCQASITVGGVITVTDERAYCQYLSEVDTAMLANLCVTEGKIGAGAVTSSKLGALACITAALDNLAVTEGKIGALAVTEGKIGTEAVTTDKIGLLAITNARLGNGSVGEVKLADGAVTVNKIGALAVTEAKIAAAAVTGAKMATPYGRGAFVWTIGGEQATGTNVGVEYTAPFALTLTGGYIQCKTAPTGASLIFDIHSGAGAGVTVFTTQPNRPTLAATATGPTAVVAPDVTAIAAGTRMILDCDQIGSTLPGEDVTVILAYKYSLSA